MIWKMEFCHPQTGERQQMVCKQLTQAYQPALLALDDEVYQGLAEKENYMPADRAELDYFFAIQARIYGVLCGGRLIAYYTLWHHEPKDAAVTAQFQPELSARGMYNLAADLPFIPQAEQSRTLEIHRALIHPAYHNFGVNQYFLPLIFKQAGELGYLHLAATISPYNCPSFISALKSGLTIGGLKQKYGGVPRYIMYQDLTGKASYQGQPKLCHHRDLAAQQQLLAAGWRGIGVEKDPARIDPQSGRPAVMIVYDLPTKQA